MRDRSMPHLSDILEELTNDKIDEISDLLVLSQDYIFEKTKDPRYCYLIFFKACISLTSVFGKMAIDKANEDEVQELKELYEICLDNIKTEITSYNRH